jgi:hypothetical protein
MSNAALTEVNWNRLIRNLLSATQNGEVQWEMIDPPVELRRYAEGVEQAYRVRFLDRTFRIVPYKYKASSDGEDFYWADGVAIEILDARDRVIYQVPGSASGQRELLDAVQFQTANLASLFSKLA